MRPCVRRNILLLCAAAVLFLPAAQPPPAHAQKRNLFDSKKTDEPPVMRKRVIAGSEVEKRIQSMREAFNPESRSNGQTLQLYCLLVLFMLCLISGLIYWRRRRRLQIEREVRDPLFLVEELNYAHQISPPEQRLMQHLAADNALRTPLNLFIEPRFFLDAREKASYASSRADIESLLRRLFNIEVNESNP